MAPRNAVAVTSIAFSNSARSNSPATVVLLLAERDSLVISPGLPEQRQGYPTRGRRWAGAGDPEGCQVACLDTTWGLGLNRGNPIRQIGIVSHMIRTRCYGVV